VEQPSTGFQMLISPYCRESLAGGLGRVGGEKQGNQSRPGPYSHGNRLCLYLHPPTSVPSIQPNLSLPLGGSKKNQKNAEDKEPVGVLPSSPPTSSAFSNFSSFLLAVFSFLSSQYPSGAPNSYGVASPSPSPPFLP
jgi:hypothetical protein